MNRKLGKEGQEFAREILQKRGYRVMECSPSYKAVNLEVEGCDKSFRISVKTSRTRRHVRLGQVSSVECLRDDDFVFAFMPLEDGIEILFRDGEYDLWIIPGKKAREDGLRVHDSWMSEPKRDGTLRSTTFGVTVKGYSQRSIQKQVWDKWRLNFHQAWHLLPPASQ